MEDARVLTATLRFWTCGFNEIYISSNVDSWFLDYSDLHWLISVKSNTRIRKRHPRGQNRKVAVRTHTRILFWKIEAWNRVSTRVPVATQSLIRLKAEKSCSVVKRRKARAIQYFVIHVKHSEFMERRLRRVSAKRADRRDPPRLLLFKFN